MALTTFGCGSLAAAGTTQGNAAAITEDTNVITGSDGVKGVILPSGCYRVAVYNSGSGSLKVYPPSGENINGLLSNVAQTMSAGTATLYIRTSGGVWRYVGLS